MWSAGIQAKATVEAAKAEASAAKMSGLASAGASLPIIIPSDERIKENINQIDALTIEAIRSVTFHYKDEWNLNSERMHHGFIKEFQKVVPMQPITMKVLIGTALQDSSVCSYVQYNN